MGVDLLATKGAVDGDFDLPGQQVLLKSIARGGRTPPLTLPIEPAS
jgi:hypothetical protein